MFLRNCWYVIAWDSDVRPGEIFARTILNEPLVLYRTASGQVVAMEDRCCHRAAPLRLGKVKGDNLQCGYHGLVFDPSGRCIHIPTQEKIPESMSVRTYPAVEKWDWIWVWMGDPESSDESLIPDWWRLDHPDWSVSRGKTFHVRANYELVSDNLLDLSHITFLHKSSLGSADVLDHPITTDRFENSVRMSRVMAGVEQAPFHKRVMPIDGLVDRWMIVEVTVPAHILVDGGNAPAGSGALEGNMEEAINWKSHNEVTPETEESSFLFYSHARNYLLGDESATSQMREEMIEIYREDIEMMEEQQAQLSREPDRELLPIQGDTPLLAARRLIRERIAEEQAPA